MGEVVDHQNSSNIQPSINLQSTFNQPSINLQSKAAKFAAFDFLKDPKNPTLFGNFTSYKCSMEPLNLTSTWPLGCKTWHFSHPTIAATWSTTWVASSIASVGVSAIDKWRLSSCSVAASFQYPLVTTRLFATKKITEKLLLLLLLPLLARVFDVPYKYGKWATHNHHKFGCWWFLFRPQQMTGWWF